jgi:predicted DNA-binding transcriptional regulator YafY
MARNSEVIRQWEILRAIDAARSGIPLAKLASAHHVHQRTIRRDIEALSKAGFPLYDEKVDGTTVWKLSGKPFRGLEETGLSVTELCALYFSRSVLEALGGAPFHDEMERAFLKLERALPASDASAISGRVDGQAVKIKETIAVQGASHVPAGQHEDHWQTAAARPLEEGHLSLA